MNTFKPTRVDAAILFFSVILFFWPDGGLFIRLYEFDLINNLLC